MIRNNIAGNVTMLSVLAKDMGLSEVELSNFQSPKKIEKKEVAKRRRNILMSAYLWAQ